MSSFLEALVTVVALVAGVAFVSVLVSRRAQTPAVIQSAASGFGNVLGVAEAPVTGVAYSPVLSYPGSDMSGAFGFGGAF